MKTEPNTTSGIYFPPGGILIWMIAFIELLTFMMALTVFALDRSGNMEIFHEGQQLLNTNIGIVNTIFLVTAGYFMATSLHQLKQGNSTSSLKNINVSILFGLSFLGLKGFEYYDKISQGIGLDYSDFFMYYWLLTGFHFIHVLAGLVILITIKIHIKRGYYSKSNFEDVETGAVFWHMCDLIWLILFPLLYLL